MARRPAHDDGKASLSIGQGDDGQALIDCKAGEGERTQDRPGPQQENVATSGDVGNLPQETEESADSRDVPDGESPEDCQAASVGDVQAMRKN